MSEGTWVGAQIGHSDVVSLAISRRHSTCYIILLGIYCCIAMLCYASLGHPFFIGHGWAWPMQMVASSLLPEHKPICRCPTSSLFWTLSVCSVWHALQGNFRAWSWKARRSWTSQGEYKYSSECKNWIRCLDSEFDFKPYCKHQNAFVFKVYQIVTQELQSGMAMVWRIVWFGWICHLHELDWMKGPQSPKMPCFIL